MKLFPIIIITLFALASAVEFTSGNWKMGLFYFFSAGINLVVII